MAANAPQGSLEFFQDGLTRFQEVENVANADNTGLGPRFNLNSCSGCHAHPSVGGTSPPANPQYAALYSGVASAFRNTIPQFITPYGPVREARLPFFTNANGTPNTSAPNGVVETLYTVAGRADAGRCSLSQPGFAAAVATNNIIYSGWAWSRTSMTRP